MTGLTGEAGIANALALTARAIGSWLTHVLNRRSITGPSALSDRQLNDIGLTSMGFRWAARQRLQIDATGEFFRIPVEPRVGRGQRTC
jgi:uncharacterized protein YjiS (DUF1127 family)